VLVNLKNHLLVDGRFIRAGIVEEDTIPMKFRHNRKVVEEVKGEDIEEEKIVADEVDSDVVVEVQQEPALPVKKKYRLKNPKQRWDR
jgi:hypothetical protein